MIDRIPKTHPRILLTDQRVAELKSLLSTDTELQTLMDHLTIVGKAICAQPPVNYRLDGTKRFRLLATSRQVLSRSLVLGTLYRLDGDARWRERLTAELKAVCAFDNWYPQHFLDTAEMSAAVALGYDWLYNDLSSDDRTTIRDGLIRLGITPGAEGRHWWVKHDNNWNQVCHAGMVLAALATAHDAPETAEALLQRAREHHVHGLAVYAPDGIYPEGPGYWNYGTSFSILMASALNSTIGTDWGILDQSGFLESFDYRMYVQTPTGRVVNYADGRSHAGSSPYHLYIAQQRQVAGARAFALASLKDDYRKIAEGHPRVDERVNRLLALAVAWYTPAQDTDSHAEQRLDWFGGGKDRVHLATMRSAWDDPDALFASLKAGVLTVNHGHLDAGTFIIESDGIRWASEFGPEKEIYDGKGTWSLDQDSYRWSFLRVNNFGHNTLTLDNALQRVKGSAPIVATGTGASPYAVADLSAAFAGQATSVKRGLMLPDRSQVLVQDELDGVPEGDTIRWTLVTRARLALSPDRRMATFTREGKSLTARVLAPATAGFSISDAKPLTEAENQNEGYQRLLIETPSTGTPMTIAVQFTPGAAETPDIAPTPLARWMN